MEGKHRKGEDVVRPAEPGNMDRQERNDSQSKLHGSRAGTFAEP